MIKSKLINKPIIRYKSNLEFFDHVKLRSCIIYLRPTYYHSYAHSRLYELWYVDNMGDTLLNLG